MEGSAADGHGFIAMVRPFPWQFDCRGQLCSRLDLGTSAAEGGCSIGALSDGVRLSASDVRLAANGMPAVSLMGQAVANNRGRTPRVSGKALRLAILAMSRLHAVEAHCARDCRKIQVTDYRRGSCRGIDREHVRAFRASPENAGVNRERIQRAVDPGGGQDGSRNGPNHSCRGSTRIDAVQLRGSFRTARSNIIGTVDHSAVIDFAGISLSPDGRLYSQITATSSDLMMIDNFQ
jgi:hypothetical protein